MHELDHGEDELIPSEVVEQLLAGEHPLKVWREYRGLTRKLGRSGRGNKILYLPDRDRQ